MIHLILCIPVVKIDPKERERERIFIHIDIMNTHTGSFVQNSKTELKKQDSGHCVINQER